MQARHTEAGKPLSCNKVSESATEPMVELSGDPTHRLAGLSGALSSRRRIRHG